MAIETLHLEAELAKAVGAQHIAAEREGLSVSPSSAEEVAEILRFANQRRIRIKLAGAGTKQDWFNPVDADLVLRTTRMNTVREHAAQDLTAIVDAGCTWGEMQRQLAGQGQCVALDPLWPERATIGGIVAANDSGTLRLRYGSLRDLIIGMTIVLADGTVARSGGKVVKNVAGYDMHKLLTGAAGTLGVITQVNFRLHPVERLTRSLTVASPDIPLLANLMHAVRGSQMMVNAMQLRVGADDSDAAANALDIMFAAGTECIEDQVKWLERSASPLPANEAAADVWLARQRTFDGASGHDLGGDDAREFVFKMSVLPLDIARLVSRLQAASASAGLRCPCVAQATGLVTASLAGDAEICVEVIREVRAEVEASSGSIVILRAPGDSAPNNGGQPHHKLDRWGTPGDALPVMRRIKLALDPNGILNPGCFIGGI